MVDHSGRKYARERATKQFLSTVIITYTTYTGPSQTRMAKNVLMKHTSALFGDSDNPNPHSWMPCMPPPMLTLKLAVSSVVRLRQEPSREGLRICLSVTDCLIASRAFLLRQLPSFTRTHATLRYLLAINPGNALGLGLQHCNISCDSLSGSALTATMSLKEAFRGKASQLIFMNCHE